jgi:hypothetical protein
VREAVLSQWPHSAALRTHAARIDNPRYGRALHAAVGLRPKAPRKANLPTGTPGMHLKHFPNRPAVALRTSNDLKSRHPD